MASTAPSSSGAAMAEAPVVSSGSEAPARQGTLLDRATSNIGLQRASTLPTDARDLRHAATMPMTYDIESDRPFCCGLWKAQQLFGAVVGITIFVVFCLARPIDTEYDKANAMMGITLLCGCFWIFEVLPIYATGLLPIVLIPACKITSTDEVAQSYWNSVQMLFIAIYLVDIALEEVGLPKRFALKALLSSGRLQPWYLLLVIMASCWVMSMFINTIAVTLMITPFVIGLMNSLEERSRDGEATGYTQEESSSADDSEAQASVESNVTKVQSIANGLLLGVAFSATAGGMATLTGSLPNRILAGDDFVSFRVTWIRWFCYGFPLSLATCLIAYGIIFLRYMRGVHMSELKKQLVQDEYEEFMKENGPFSRDELLVGIAQVVQITLLIVNPWLFSPLVESDHGARLLSDATVAAVPALTLFVMPSVSRPGQSVLTWTAVHEKLDFGMLLLIGGGFAIGRGFTDSGLEDAMGHWFARSTTLLGGFPLAVVVLVMGSLATQFLSSAACATTLLSVLKSASLNAVVNPLQMLLPGTIACSLAFMLPTAAPGNVVVLARSQELSQSLEARDFLLTGFPINLISIPVVAVMGKFLGAAVFDSDTPFPLSTCAESGVSCQVLPIPGMVQGHYVDMQACHVLDVADVNGEKCTTCCQLWNRTIVDLGGFPQKPYAAGEVQPDPMPDNSSGGPEPEPMEPEPEAEPPTPGA
mmetsp:Transcript_101328/g.284052  ORF Transcript_101328/g.284052 Transcript_101328/m.284052 type:complete len:703 (+) Transcript_101328:83-2191(+)